MRAIGQVFLFKLSNDILRVFALSLCLLIFSACTEGIPEFDSLNSSDLPPLIFDKSGTTDADFAVVTISNPLEISASCHEMTQSLEWSFDGGTTWKEVDVSQLDSSSDVSCTEDGVVNFKFQNLSLFSNLTGQGDSASLLFRVTFQERKSQPSSATINWVSPGTLQITSFGTYNFGSVTEGATQLALLEVFNPSDYIVTGISTLGVISPEIDYSGGEYPGTGGNCGNQLKAGANCQLALEFSPPAQASYFGTIKLSFFDGLNTQSSSASLSGSGSAAASLSLTEVSYDYSLVPVGSNSIHTFTLTNSGGTKATAINIMPLPAEFTLATSPCSELPAQSSCSFDVTFEPQAAQIYNETVTLSFDNGVVSVTDTNHSFLGEGVAPAKLDLTNGSTYNFGNVVLGTTSAAHIFTVSNSGGWAASSVATGFSIATDFTLDQTTCTGSLAPSALCEVHLRAHPQAAVLVTTDRPVINYDNGVSSSQSLNLYSKAIGIQPAKLESLTNLPYTFSDTVVSESSTANLSITNAGEEAAAGINFNIVAPFSYLSDDCGGSLAPDDSCSVQLDYSPTTSGLSNQNLVVTYSSITGSLTLQMAIKGKALRPASLSTTLASTYDFGAFAVGTTSGPLLFDVTNSGEVAATLLSTSLTNTSDFAFTGSNPPGSNGTCASTLGAGSTCKVEMIFNPSEVSASLLGKLNLVYETGSGSSTDTLEQSFEGVGLSSGQVTILYGVSYDFGELSYSTTDTMTFSISNSGGSALVITSILPGTADAPFKLDSHDCPASLASANACGITIEYSPTTSGIHFDDLEIIYDNSVSTGLNKTMGLRGAMKEALLTVAGIATYDFGSQVQGSTTTHTFTLSNAGTETATNISNNGLLSDAYNSFSQFSDACSNAPAELAPGEICLMQVQVKPGSINPSEVTSGSGSLSYDSYPGATQSVYYGFQVTNLLPGVIEFMPSTPYSYSTLVRGSTSQNTFTISNSGQSNLTLQTLGLNSGNQYQIVSGGSCLSGMSLPASGFCTLQVEFLPTTYGVLEQDMIVITYHDDVLLQSESGQKTIEGTGLEHGTASKLVFTTSPTSPTTAGETLLAIIEVRDDYNNLVSTGAESTLTVSISQNTGPPGASLNGILQQAATGGVVRFGESEAVYLDLVGSYTLQAQSGALTSTISGSFNIIHGPAANLVVSGMPSSAVTAGSYINPTVSIVDAYGNLVDSTADSSATISVSISSTGQSGTLFGTPSLIATSGVATFTSPGNGLYIDIVGTGYTLGFKKSSESGSDVITANSSAFSVTPGQLDSFNVSGINDPTTAGTSENLTVMALDGFGNIKSDYTGTITFTSSDSSATLPGNYSFISANNGIKTFTSGLTFFTAGLQSVTVTDTVQTSKSGAQSSITVEPGALDSFSVSGINSPTSAGTAESVTVKAYDAYNNLKTDYTGEISFFSSDTSADLPGNFTFQILNSGQMTFNNGVIFKTVGVHSLSVKDTTLTSITGNQSPIQVDPGSAAQLTYSTQPVDAYTNKTVSFQIDVEDIYGNSITSDNTTRITLSGGAGLSPSPAWVQVSAGVASFAVSFSSAGAGYFLNATSSAGISGATSNTFMIWEPLSVAYTSSTPTSPSYDSTPLIKGTTSVSATDVVLYSDSSCSTQIATGTRTTFEGSGIGISVNTNDSTSIYATARNSSAPLPNESDCTFLVTYVHDSILPSISIDSAPPSYTHETTVTFNFSSNETVNYHCSLNGAAFSACSSTHSQTSLVDGSYSLTVKAEDSAGNFSPDATTSWTVQSVPPDPSSFTATPISDTQIDLSWTSGGKTTAGYTIAYQASSLSNCNTGITVNLTNSSTSFSATGLSPGTTYYFMICSINSASPPTSSPGVSTFATTNSATPAIDGITLVSVGSNTISVGGNTVDLRATVTAGGSPVSGETLVIIDKNSSNFNFNPASGTSDINGQVSFQLTGTNIAGDFSFAVSVSGQALSSSAITVIQNPGPLANLDLKLKGPKHLKADGSSSTDINVFATDIYGNFIPNHSLAVTSTPVSSVTHTSSLVTDAAGFATFGVTSGSYVGPVSAIVSSTSPSISSSIDLELHDWWDLNWSNRMKITFDNSTRAASLTIPLLVKLDPSNFDYSKANLNGGDLRFIDSDGITELPYEIENWDPLGTSNIWVKATTIAPNSSYSFNLYYNNSSATAPTGTSPFLLYGGVWHLNQAPVNGNPSIIDSSLGDDGVPLNMTDGNANGNIDLGLPFDGTDDKITLASSVALSIESNASTTYSAWVQVNTLSGYQPILSKLGGGVIEYFFGLKDGYPYFEYQKAGGGGPITTATSATQLTVGDWHYITMHVDTSNKFLYMYVDGVRTEIFSLSGQMPGPSTYPAHIGHAPDITNYYFDGVIDEVRILKAPRSDAEVAAEYVNQSGGGITYGLTEFVPETGAAIFGDGRDGDLNITTADILDPRNTPLSTGQNISYNGRVTNVSADGLTLSLDGALSAQDVKFGDEVLWAVMAASSPTSCGAGLDVGMYGTSRIVSANYVTPSVQLNKILGSTSSHDNTNIGQTDLSLDFCLIQLVRVPHFKNLQIASSYTLKAPKWQMASGTGGILAFRTKGSLSVDGNLSADMTGYEGGISSSPGQGDGIRGPGAPPASSGAATYNHNGGGALSGQRGGGGGHIGAGGDGASQDMGGRSLKICNGKFCGINRRLLMGGGGGGGFDSGSNGGKGGGILLIFARTLVDGTGIISSNGQAGTATTYSGGGGAGGTTALITKSSGSVPPTLEAKGGNGGDSTVGFDSGGGGGGHLLFATCSADSTLKDVSGGANSSSDTEAGGDGIALSTTPLEATCP